jgi:hypothetical protein
MEHNQHRSNFRSHQELFDEEFKTFHRSFNVVMVLGILFSLVMSAAVIVGIILAWKHWG